MGEPRWSDRVISARLAIAAMSSSPNNLVSGYDPLQHPFSASRMLIPADPYMECGPLITSTEVFKNQFPRTVAESFPKSKLNLQKKKTFSTFVPNTKNINHKLK